MNYILQINAFWKKFNQLPDRKPFHITLFFALMSINNTCGWKETFGVDFSTILDLTRLDKSTYYKSAEYLFVNGFLDVYQKGRNQHECARFAIRVLYDISESTQNADVMHTESERNILKQVNNIKNKKNIYPQFFEIEKFFLENNSKKEEAEKFYNYNESRCWKNIESWQPLAKNWILKSINLSKNQSNVIRTNFKQNTSRFFISEQDYTKGF